MLSSLKNRGKGNSFFLIDNSFALENTFLYLLFSFVGAIQLRVPSRLSIWLIVAGIRLKPSVTG